MAPIVWIESLAVDLVDITLTSLPTAYEKLHFLRFLEDANFTPRYSFSFTFSFPFPSPPPLTTITRHSNLYSLVLMLHQCNLSQLINIGTTLPDPNSVIALFLSKEMYGEARKYARESAVGERATQYNDEITIAQVETYIRKRYGRTHSVTF